VTPRIRLNCWRLLTR